MLNVRYYKQVINHFIPSTTLVHSVVKTTLLYLERRDKQLYDLAMNGKN